MSCFTNLAVVCMSVVFYQPVVCMSVVFYQPVVCMTVCRVLSTCIFHGTVYYYMFTVTLWFIIEVFYRVCLPDDGDGNNILKVTRSFYFITGDPEW